MGDDNKKVGNNTAPALQRPMPKNMGYGEQPKTASAPAPRSANAVRGFGKTVAKTVTSYIDHLTAYINKQDLSNVMMQFYLQACTNDNRKPIMISGFAPTKVREQHPKLYDIISKREITASFVDKFMDQYGLPVSLLGLALIGGESTKQNSTHTRKTFSELYPADADLVSVLKANDTLGFLVKSSAKDVSTTSLQSLGGKFMSGDENVSVRIKSTLVSACGPQFLDHGVFATSFAPDCMLNIACMIDVPLGNEEVLPIAMSVALPAYVSGSVVYSNHADSVQLKDLHGVIVLPNMFDGQLDEETPLITVNIKDLETTSVFDGMDAIRQAILKINLSDMEIQMNLA